MTTRDAYLLSPYRPPTSYAVSLNADEAASWLSAYFALWHPAVLRTLARPPQFSSSYDHDQPAEHAIYAVPEGPQLYQPDDWNDRVSLARAVTVRATPNRAETLSQLLAALRSAPNPDDSGTPMPLLDAAPDLVRNFAGIGYGYLIVETLFDAMDHEHLLDADGFWSDVSNAVQAAESLETVENAMPNLRSAAEKLRTAREALNSNTIHWLDLAVPDRDKLDAPWPHSLRHGLPLTLLASGEILTRLHDDHPSKFAELRSRFAPGLPPSVDIVCGAFREREDAILPAESQWWNLAAARKTVQTLFGEPPTVYGRHRTALHVHLPGWLQHAGFKHAVMTNFDGALTPVRNAAVVNWPGPDGKSIDAFAREPHPTHDPLTFFNLPFHIYQAMTQDSAPTVALMHRGDLPTIGYDELLALADLGDVIGAFTGLSRYLSEYHYGEYLGAATADDFFSDYLDDRVTRLRRPDAVSGFSQHYRLRRQLDGAFTLAALHRMLTPPTADEESAVQKLAVIEDAIETRGADVGIGSDSLAPDLVAIETDWATRLAARIQARSPANQPGLLVFNPCGFARRAGLELDPFPVPIPVDGAVKAAQFDADKTRLVVEVPALGFAWIPRPTRTDKPFTPPKPRLKMAEGTTVRNEYFEADIDPATGSIRAFRDTRTRLNRLGMQLVFNPGSKMRATDIRVSLSGTAVGEITAEGEILDEHDAILAKFRQRVRAWIGRPALEVSIELDPIHQPTGYPWHAYFGARVGWRDERAAIFRGVHGANTQSSYTRPGSPDYVELRLAAERTFVFTGGLPFTQRHGGRMADFVLIPEGEQGRRFDLLFACDRDYPMPTAMGWCAPTPVIPTDRGPPPVGASGWLAHLDLPSLLMTGLRPVPSVSDADTGRVRRAVAARFIECAGFGGSSDLRFAKDPSRVVVIDGDNGETQSLTLSDGAIPLEFSANEALRVRAEWV